MNAANKSHDLTVEEFLERLSTLDDWQCFSEHHAAAMLGMTVRTLKAEREEHARIERKDPAAAAKALEEDFVPWFRAGKAGVRYQLGKLKEYIRRPPRAAKGSRAGAAGSAGAGGRPVAGDTAAAMAAEPLLFFAGRLMDGKLPFAVQAGFPQDFFATADQDDIDDIAWLVPEEAALMRAAGLRLKIDPVD